nr:MAG TPA: hypothetical protein [Caudoviricetes sp.]
MCNVKSLLVWCYIYEATMKQFNRGEITVFVISMKQKCYIYRTFIGHLDYKANRDN